MRTLATAGGWQQRTPGPSLGASFCCTLNRPEWKPSCTFHTYPPQGCRCPWDKQLWGAGPSARLASLLLQLVACCAWRRRSIQLAHRALALFAIAALVLVLFRQDAEIVKPGGCSAPLAAVLPLTNRSPAHCRATVQ